MLRCRSFSRAWWSNDDPRARLTLTRRWLEIAPDDVDLRLRLLSLLEQTGSLPEARRVARALRADPLSDARVRTAVGEFWLRQEDPAEARRVFSEIVEHAPLDPWARRRLGDLYRAHEWADDAYRAYGYYSEHLSFIFFEGMTGAETRDKLMMSFRDQPPVTLGGFKIGKVSHQVQDSQGTYIVKYELEGVEAEVFVRPSGTEPKVKFYVLLRDGRVEGMSGDIAAVKHEANAVVEKIDHEIMAIAQERSSQ